MDSFKPQAPLARTKINCIIQEADVPLDPSMHAKRNKGVRLEDFAGLLPDEQGPELHSTIQPTEPTDGLETLSLIEFFRRLSLADGVRAQTKSLAASEALHNIVDDLMDASLVAELHNGRTQNDEVTTKAFRSLVEYVSATTAAAVPLSRQWDHLTLFEASIDDIQEEAQTFFYVPSMSHPVRPADWRAGYGLLFVIPRLTNAMSLPQGKRLTPRGPVQISGVDPTSAVASGLRASDDSLVAPANYVSQRMSMLADAMLRTCPARTHVFSLVYVCDDRRLCFYYRDRSRSVFSNGAVLDKQNEDFETLVSALLGVLSHSNVQYGLQQCFTPIGAVPAVRAEVQLFGDMSSLAVKVGPRTFQLGRRVDTAPYKYSFETSRYLARLTDGLALPSQADSDTRTKTEGADALVSFRWVTVADEAHNEAHLLRLGRQRGVGEVAAIYDSQFLSDYGGWGIPSAAARPHSLLLASVMEPLIPLDEVRGVEQFKRAFRSIVRGAPKFHIADSENARLAMLTS
jgi:hypothetical protein